jgi:uncharacterized membrane protein YdjX (TVP38/TMEM64 family)
MLKHLLRHRELINFLLVFGVIYLVLKIFLIPLINSPEFIAYIKMIGLWGYLIIIFYVVLSHVFAPISGTPAIAFGVMIYGINVGMTLVYLASVISCVINFYISRRFGRDIIKNFVGSRAIKEIDRFAAVEGTNVLWICRLIGFSFFDFISYAAGLTKIKFKEYFYITAVGNLISNIAIQIIFARVNFNSEKGLFLWFGSLAVAAIIFGIYLKNYLAKNTDLEK